MTGRDAPVLALVELAADSDVDLRHRLMDAAYRASRDGTVVVVLRGVDRAAADRLMDRIVSSVGVRVRGVRYLDASDREALEPLLRAAPAVVATSSTFASAARPLARDILAPEEAIRLWSA